MAAGGVWKRSSHADIGGQKQQEYHFPPEINVIKRTPLPCLELFLAFPPPCFVVERQDLKADDLKRCAMCRHTPAHGRHAYGVPRH